MFCSDGIFETLDASGSEFGAARLCQLVQAQRASSARAIVDAVFDAVAAFRGSRAQDDDMTAVAVKITS